MELKVTRVHSPLETKERSVCTLAGPGRVGGGDGGRGSGSEGFNASPSSTLSSASRRMGLFSNWTFDLKISCKENKIKQAIQA